MNDIRSETPNPPEHRVRPHDARDLTVPVLTVSNMTTDDALVFLGELLSRAWLVAYHLQQRHVFEGTELDSQINSCAVTVIRKQDERG